MPEEQLPEEEQHEDDELPVAVDIRDAQKEIRAKKTKAIAAFAYWIAIGDREIRKELGLPETEQEFADKHNISRRQLQRIKKLKAFQHSVDQVQKTLWAIDAKDYDYKIRKAFLKSLVSRPSKGGIELYFRIRKWWTADGQDADPSVPKDEGRDMSRDELLGEVTQLIANDPQLALEGDDDTEEDRPD